MKNKTTIYIALFFHLLIPFFSIGFLHPDEQYFVLDFAFDKLGMIDNYIKSWEYNAQIRPWFLPSIFYFLGFILKSMGITNPFTMSLLFRLCSSLLGFFAHFFFIKEITKKYSDIKFNHLYWVFLLAWPILLMHSRTNSENWSTSFFLIGLSLLLNKKKDFLSGVLFAFTFFTRFQTGFLLLPILFLYKKRIKDITFLALSFLITSTLLTGIDYWGYEKLTFTPFNYLMVNLIEGKVNTFGTSSVFFFLYKSVTKLLPFWGIACLSILVIAIKKCKTNSLYQHSLILVLPFLIIHHLIGHKELRFIYSVFPICLILLSYHMDFWKPKWNKVFIIGNFVAFPVLFIPMYKPMTVYTYLYSQKSVIKNLYYLTPHNPLELKSLLPKNIELLSYKKDSRSKFILVQNYKQLKKIKMENRCKYLISTYPIILLEKNPYKLLSRSNIWAILKCNPL